MRATYERKVAENVREKSHTALILFGFSEPLNQRVQGSSPGAPTNLFKALAKNG
jgi:hypothetical protein